MLFNILHVFFRDDEKKKNNISTYISSYILKKEKIPQFWKNLR